MRDRPTHLPPLFATMYAVSGLPWPDTMSVLPPYTSGVMEFVVERASKGTLHSSCPSAAFTPTRFFCENTITCRVPPISAMIGEP